jgi:hypothetical protein
MILDKNDLFSDSFGPLFSGTTITGDNSVGYQSPGDNQTDLVAHDIIILFLLVIIIHSVRTTLFVVDFKTVATPITVTRVPPLLDSASSCFLNPLKALGFDMFTKKLIL